MTGKFNKIVKIPILIITIDRYLLIDNNIEIILTSGFDNLFDENKDFTYIVRTRF